MNLGLSSELKIAFPDIIPVHRPSVLDYKIKDPNWLAGFTSAEGCFFINIYKSKTKVGVTVNLIFQLSQHARDELLLRSLIEYFGCGNLFKKRETFELVFAKFADIDNKIIPFFAKYPIAGVKFLDFQDFCKVANIMKEKGHLNIEGLNLIRKLKEGMNTGRIS